MSSGEKLTIETDNDGKDIELRSSNFDNALVINDDVQRVGIGTDVGGALAGAGSKLTVAGEISSSLGFTTDGHITASGNVSSSGALSVFGEVVHLEGTDPRLKLKAKGANHPGVEWHEDSTRKWVLYNDPDESDKLVFKNDSTELVKINQAGATEFTSHITASGNIS